MTVKELKEALEKYDDNLTVIIDSICTPTKLVEDEKYPGEVEIWYQYIDNNHDNMEEEV